MKSDKCEFCFNKSLSSQIVAENKFARLLYPLKPIIFGHFMVLPKRHESIFTDLSDEELVAVKELIREVYTIFQKRNNATGFNLLNNNGKSAGQHVSHVHIHVFMRSESDKNPFNILSKKIDKEKLAKKEWDNRLLKIKSWLEQ